MKNHRDEYIEIRDGAITYFEKADERSDDIIKLYKNGKDPSKKMNIVAIIKQRDSHRKVFLDSMEEFNSLKEKIEVEVKKEDKDAKIEEKESNDGEIEIQNAGDDNSSEDGATKEEKTVASEIKELEEKAKAMEEAGKLLEGDLNSINGLKNNLMAESVSVGTILEARRSYEQAQDKMNITTAKYMIEKNILVAKREAVILDINRAIAAGEDVSSLQYSLIDINNEVENLDKEYEMVFPKLQKEVAGAQRELKETSKEVSKKVTADFKNSYKQVKNYSEGGILQSESTDLTKNLNRVVLNTSYNENIVADGKANSVSAETININGQTVRVVSKEYSGGVETSYLDGNVEQMRAGTGEIQYVTRDSNGSLIADNPELEDSLKRIGIEDVDDVQEACEKIDEKAEKNDDREYDDDGYPDPSLTNNY